MPEADQIEPMRGEEMRWFFEEGHLVYMITGIQDQERVDEITRFFLASCNCETDIQGLDNGFLVKIIFAEKTLDMGKQQHFVLPPPKK